MAIDRCVENSSGFFLKALTALTPKNRPRDDPRPPIPAGIQDDVHLKTRLGVSARLPVTTIWKPMSTACRGRWPAVSTNGETTSGALYSNPAILKTNRCGRWPGGWWEFLLHLSPLATTGAIAVSDSEKTEALAENLEAQFQLVNDPSVPAVMKTVDVTLWS